MSQLSDVLKPSALTADELTKGLLRHYQRDFPIVSRPFQLMAEVLDCTEQAVLTTLMKLKDEQVLTRIGPIFDHKRAGASLLAAISAPGEDSDSIAEIINSYPEVNHNYGREHFYNLWFVVTAPDQAHLDATLLDMEQTIGLPILRLPMVKSYHIDLGFQIAHEKHLSAAGHSKGKGVKGYSKNIIEIEETQLVDDIDLSDLLCEMDQHRLRSLIQDGLPLSITPFISLAEQLGAVSEQQVLTTLKYWLKNGLVKRIGLVTNHHQLGYTSNAMVVWNVAEDKIDRIGELIKHSGLVSLCYQRERRMPDWTFNLYCMIHSRDRENVSLIVEELCQLAELQHTPKEVLFTTRQYKQKGGLYSIRKGADKVSNDQRHIPLAQAGVA